MLARVALLILACGVSVAGCAERAREAPSSETQEITDNLVKAGFPPDDIQVVEGVVYVGRDAVVTLAASREMLQGDHDSKEQYRTNNIIFPLPKICINAPAFVGVFRTALDLAIQNYNEQRLSFGMVHPPDGGCNFTINAILQPGPPGGVAGFPSGGLPFGSFTINDGLGALGVDTIEHVITHELGHTVGFRHSDFFDRSISCPDSGGNEGSDGVGANHIPGTPTGAVLGGSVMNSCFRTFETGEFTPSDVTALQALYRGGCSEGACFTSCRRAGFCDGFCTSDSNCVCFGRRPCL